MTKKEEIEESSANFTREVLGSIKPNNYKEEETPLSSNDAKNRASDIRAFYDNYGRDMIRNMINGELLKCATITPDKLLFAQGTLNGLMLIEEELEIQSGISQNKEEDENELGVSF